MLFRSPMSTLTVCLLFVYGLVFSLLTIPRVAQIVRKYKIYRKPSKRDLHWRLVPKLTGIVFYAAFLVISFAFVPYTDPKRLILLLCAGAVVVYVGIRDDIFERASHPQTNGNNPEYIQKDEYVEVTPKALRLRKILLQEHERKRNSKQ